MKIKQLKDSVEIEIEDNYDLWVLYKILKDSKFKIGTLDFRTLKVENKERKIKAFIEIDAEKVTFEDGRLRVIGKITGASNEEIPLGQYHSFEIKEGMKYKIKKEWRDWEIKLIKKTLKPKKKILLISFDYGETVGYLLGNKLEKIFEYNKNLPGKDDPNYSKERENYLNEVIKKIEEIRNGYQLIVGAHSVMLDKLKEKINANFVPISNTGARGIHEIIKKGIKQIEEENRIMKETQVVEEFLKRIARDELVVYGFEQVKKAVEYGAADTILVSEDLIFKDETIQRLIKEGEKVGAKIEIISTDHEAGEQFKGFGIAAFLRFQI